MPLVLYAKCCGCPKEQRYERSETFGGAMEGLKGWMSICPCEVAGGSGPYVEATDLVCPDCIARLPEAVRTRLVELAAQVEKMKSEMVGGLPWGGPRGPRRPPTHMKPVP